MNKIASNEFTFLPNEIILFIKWLNNMIKKENLKFLNKNAIHKIPILFEAMFCKKSLSLETLEILNTAKVTRNLRLYDLEACEN